MNKTERFVFAIGFVGLSLQILAGRLLIPNFGSSVYTWGSIIGIFMAALALGYYTGGKIATRPYDITVLALIIAIWCGLLAYTGTYLSTWISSWGITTVYAALPAVILLFAVPSFIVGMITPIAAERHNTKHKGEATARIIGLDTLGSILGVFLTTFILIPQFDIRVSFAMLGLVLTVLACFNLKNKRFLWLIIVVIVLLVLVFVPRQGYDQVSVQSEYQLLEVKDTGSIRTLYADGGPQSAYNKNNPLEHVYEYTKYADLVANMTTVESALFIGGGGFTLPKQFVAKGANVTVIELDPAVIDIATTYFDVNEDSMTIINGDGRTYLRDNNATFDMIVVDAYRKDRVPFHLATREFYVLVRNRLKPQGVVMTNIIATPSSDWYAAARTTMASVFDTTYAFSMQRSNKLQNIELIATDAAELSPQQLYVKAPSVVHLDRMLTIGEGIILYDARAPIDTLLSRLVNVPAEQ